jgi:hypothetical protein
MVDETHIEGGIVDDEFSTLDVIEKIRGQIGEAWLVGEKFVADAMHLHGAGIDYTVRLQVLVIMTAGQSPAHQFHATDLDDAVTLGRRQAGGFRIQYDLSHVDS